MALDLEKIKELALHPLHKGELDVAIHHQGRLRFHTEPFLRVADMGTPLTQYLDWVKTLIPKDKFEVFLSLFKLPSQSVELTEKIYTELERVFDGRDAVADYQFTDSKYKDDWEWYRQERLHEPKVWHLKGWDMMKTSINSVLVVDMPTDSRSEYPEPYFYWVDVADIIDYSCKGGKMEYIIYHGKDDTIAEIDDECYRLFAKDKDGKMGGLISENEHGLGYCPCAWFWTTPLNGLMRDVKKAPISAQLGNLDWYLFFAISKRHLDLYAPYPIYSAYQADCTYRNNETGDYCDGGFLRNTKHNNEWVMTAEGTICRCPICSEKRISGAGSFIEVPIPSSKDDVNLSDPVHITTIDKTSLDYNTSEIARLKNEIFVSATGSGGDVEQKEAINETQVMANFEAKRSVLLALKQNFERAQTFVEETICRLRYGEKFLSLSINWGTEFYLYSVAELQDAYKKEKESGASEARMDAISEQIIYTENRNNPVQMQRMILLKHLEPYRHRTFDELMELKEKGLVDDVTLCIKTNFSAFVERFERENMNIIEFGSNLTMDKKISIINDKLKEYAEEIINGTTRPTASAERWSGGSNGEGGAEGASTEGNGGE